MNTITKRLLPTLLITAVTSPALAGTCPTDLDGDGNTGFSDLTAMLNAWGPCAACPADVNGDDNVGFADLTELLNAWGPCPIDTFPYPVYENLFALEVGQQFVNGASGITLPQTTYDRIDRDMSLILAAHPELNGSEATHGWRWVPFEMIVGIDTDLPSDEFDATLAFYQGEVITVWFGGDMFDTMLHLDFPLGANPRAMIPILEAIDSVEFAEVNTFFGPALQPRWAPSNVGGGGILWTVVVGWDNGDSFPGPLCDGNSTGCECFSTYEFFTQANGTLILLDIDSVRSPWNANGTCVGYPPTP